MLAGNLKTEEIQAARLRTNDARVQLGVDAQRLGLALEGLEKARMDYYSARRTWEESNSAYEMAVTVEIRVLEEE